jgi:DNA-directed RNA polymerase specialized sigma24 family protein
MKAPLLVDALRARDPGAPAALYDAHAENLFRYCWFILRNRDAAQAAVRDTLVVAESHVDRLRDPQMLRPWLYALARAECRRKQRAGGREIEAGQQHDAVIGRPDQPDIDRRLIAWQAVTSLGPDEREALELTLRHGMDPAAAALVLRTPVQQVTATLDRARPQLELALAGEILARRAVHGCPQRAAVLTGWAGQLTDPLRRRLVQHASSCDACGRYLPRNVSATKVYSLLPIPVPPQAMRLRVMTCFTDPALVGYRMFVSSRVTSFDQAGFPCDRPDTPRAERRSRAWVGPVAAGAAVAVLLATVLAISRLGAFNTAVQGVASAVGGRPAVVLPSAAGAPVGTTPVAGRDRRSAARASGRATVLAGTRETGAPVPLYLRSGTRPESYPPTGGQPGPGPGQGGAGHLGVSPGQLSLGPDSTGQVTLTAVDGPVTWSATSSSAEITLSSDGGTLADGQQVVLTVDVNRSSSNPGQAAITFGPGGATVTVSWTSPVTTPPPPISSPSPTVISPSPSSRPAPAPIPTTSSTPDEVPSPAP